MASKNLSTSVPFLVPPQGEAEGAVASAFSDETLAFNPEVLNTVLHETRALPGLAGPEAVFAQKNFLPAWFLEVGASLARAIAFVEASGVDFRGQEGSWSGTGVLVSNDILLTNNHVLNTLEVAREATCTFNYQVDRAGQRLPTKRFRFAPDRLFVTSSVLDGLDYTFVWVDGEPGKEFGFIPLSRDPSAIAAKQFANIIQHPNGRLKEVVLQQNEISQALETVLHYLSDTEPGSSGACVFNNAWRAIALHHASSKGEDDVPFTFGGGSPTVNEGIRFSAIAAHLDKLAEQPDTRQNARTLLQLFDGTDPLLGFFGALGRSTPESASPLEAVVDAYRGEADDVDVGFWNIEHFEDHFLEKMEAVGRIIIEMNLDVWAFEESSPQATQALVDHLKARYDADFDHAPSQDGQQVTTVIWNTKTIDGRRAEWPDEIDGWFKVHSDNFDDLPFEAAAGPIFPRYPALFSFRAANRAADDAFDFFLVPLHLKAMPEGSMRRRMASRILAAAVKKMTDDFNADQDWVLGGDLNATLASEDLQALGHDGLVPVSAKDEDAGAITYVKRPHLSLIDHIYLSPNLAQAHGAEDFFIVAKERTFPDYIRDVSDHRPVLVRLSLGRRDGGEDNGGVEAVAERGQRGGIPDSLREALAALGT